MSDLNKVMLIGRFGGDPEIKPLPSGERVANFSLATGDKWRDKTTGDMKERTEWHRIVAYGKVVDVIEKYTRKGSQVFIEGQLRTRKWQDKQGSERYTTEIVMQNIQLLGKPGDGGRENPPPGDPPRTHGNPARQSATAGAPAGKDDLDDDIPF
jgi:single-strand DNA-binding protein